MGTLVGNDFIAKTQGRANYHHSRMEKFNAENASKQGY